MLKLPEVERRRFYRSNFESGYRLFRTKRKIKGVYLLPASHPSPPPICPLFDCPVFHALDWIRPVGLCTVLCWILRLSSRLCACLGQFLSFLVGCTHAPLVIAIGPHCARSPIEDMNSTCAAACDPSPAVRHHSMVQITTASQPCHILPRVTGQTGR